MLAFSSNVRLEVAAHLSSRFSILLSHYLGVYLGMPLLHCRISKGTHHFHVEKVHKKLSV